MNVPGISEQQLERDIAGSRISTGPEIQVFLHCIMCVYSFRYAKLAVGDHGQFQATVEDYRAFIAFHTIMAIKSPAVHL